MSFQLSFSELVVAMHCVTRVVNVSTEYSCCRVVNGWLDDVIVGRKCGVFCELICFYVLKLLVNSNFLKSLFQSRPSLTSGLAA